MTPRVQPTGVPRGPFPVGFMQSMTWITCTVPHLCAHHSLAHSAGMSQSSSKATCTVASISQLQHCRMLCLGKDSWYHGYHGAAVPGLRGRGHGSAWGHHGTWGQSSAWPSVAALSPTMTICHPDTHPASVRVSSSHGEPIPLQLLGLLHLWVLENLDPGDGSEELSRESVPKKFTWEMKSPFLFG